MSPYDKATPRRAFRSVLALLSMNCVLILGFSCGPVAAREQALQAIQPAGAGSGMIAFSSNRADYNDEIFIMNSDGSRVTRLTYSLASDREPAISPDGTQIVFVSDRDAQVTNNVRTSDLYVINIDGTNIRRLTTSTLPGSGFCGCNRVGPMWSPGGTKIAFSNQKAILVVDVGSGVKTELSTPPTGFFDSNPTWSPDATKIAFDRSDGQGKTGIYVMNADGANPHQLFFYNSLAIQPAWSPDGSKIAFVSYNSNAFNIINIINADGTGSVKTLTKATTGGLGVPRWSLDGSYIAFQSSTMEGNFTPAGNFPAVELYLVDVNDTVRIRLTRNDVHDESPSFGPGSVPANIQPPPTGFGRIAFMGGFTPVSGNRSVQGLFTMNPEGWDIRLVHIGSTDVTVSGVRTLTTYGSPGFSADGKRLAMVRSTHISDGFTFRDESRLALMDADGTNETIISVYEDNSNDPPTLAGVGYPALNPDGTKVVFSTSRWREACTIGCTHFGVANADANLTGLFKWSPLRVDYASWNPLPGDGRIAYEWGMDKPTIAVASSFSPIVFNTADDPPYSGDTLDRGIGQYQRCGDWPTGTVQKTFIAPPVWTGDGQSVAYVRQTRTKSATSTENCGVGEDNVELVVANAATHVQTVILQSDVVNPTGVNPIYIMRLAWSPQNNKLAMIRNDSNLYVMNADGTSLKRITNNSFGAGFTLFTDSVSWIPTTFTQLPAVNYSIGGQVKSAQGSSGVLITLSGAKSATRTTDASGQYVFSDLLAGSNYTVTASGNLTPVNQAINNLSGDMTVNFAGAGIDVDGNRNYDALTDGLLLVRYLFGLTGSSLTSGAIGAGATRTTSAEIVQYLDTIKPALDVDGNGQADALTDGLMLVRYLFGLRGSSLIAGAIKTGAPRNSATLIEAYIQALMP